MPHTPALPKPRPRSNSAPAPAPLLLSTWVGYDLDGRTDIGWTTSIAFRLREKALRLASYAASLRAVDGTHPLLATLDAAHAHSAEMAELFSAPDIRQALREAGDARALREALDMTPPASAA